MIPQRTRIDLGFKEKQRVMIQDSVFKVQRIRPNGKVTLRFEGKLGDTQITEEELLKLKEELKELEGEKENAKNNKSNA